MTPRSRGRGTILVVGVKEYRPQAWDGGWNGGPCEGVPTVHSLRRKTSHLIGMVLAWGRVGAGAGQRGRGQKSIGRRASWGRRASSDVTQQSGVSWCGIPEAYVGCESLLRKLSSTKVVACLKVRMGSVAVCD